MESDTSVFRSALANDNRMCMCGILSAKVNDLPAEECIKADRFGEANVGWLEQVLDRAKPKTTKKDLKEHAAAILATVEGGQLVARRHLQTGIYDRAVRTYRATGLIS